MQFKGKLMKHTWENGKSLVWGRILALLVQIWAPNFFAWILLPLLDARNCGKLSLCAILRKTNEPNFRKWQKKNKFWTWFWPIWPKFGLPFYLFIFFFFKNLAPSFTRCHGQLSSCTISEKTNDPILGKLSDGQTDRQTDWQEWFHRTLSD